MAPLPMSVTFLGTSSGGGPSESRNCSSLVADVLGDGSLWMVDCAEGTLRQFALQPGYGADRIKVSKLSKMFITHMHADHVMGIITVLRSLLGIPKPDAGPSQKPPRVEIYGPAGLRTFVRSILKMTMTSVGDRYVVHELLGPDDAVTPCSQEVVHSSECEGRDIRCGEDGFWRDVVSGGASKTTVTVDAGFILHRDPCIGYVFRESAPLSRKIVVLGDTYDPSAIAPLCLSASLLVHESTDAYMPPNVDPEAKRTVETINAKVVERGHSTPTMAGAFAKLIEARQLVMNHIGCRFPAPQLSHRQRNTKALREGVLKEMERQANEAWGLGRAQSAVDYLKVNVYALRGDPELEPEQDGAEEAAASWRPPPTDHHLVVHNNRASYRGHRGMDHGDRGAGGSRGYRRDDGRGAGGMDHRGRGRGDGRGYGAGSMDHRGRGGGDSRGYRRGDGRGAGSTDHRGGGGFRGDMDYGSGDGRGAGGDFASDRTEPKRKRLDP
ncbi:hypothetical protein FIBSPDRAFT_856635 [Athelia psychrophila]|uniref:Uncharacterized protein n=1 Tax=Athelia psychrophila TaxID=1759441 RepID=A0A166NBD3_9AGAM|nr:hypothetical protein FIBSPDRAFT_856635 [Fibularhizoctonia sp. CBS 109695]